MSGGHFNYCDSRAKTEIFGWEDNPRNVFEDREISELVWDVFDLIHDYDWYASCDTDEESWLAAKAKFKEKWLRSDPEDRIRRIIDETVDDLRQELFETFLPGKAGGAHGP